jgi:hypothetical protein
MFRRPKLLRFRELATAVAHRFRARQTRRNLGPNLEDAITISIDMPGREQRRAHWQQAAGDNFSHDLENISNRFRLSGGNVRRAAKIAAANVALSGRQYITVTDVSEATRSLNRQSLDTLATRVLAPAIGIVFHSRADVATNEQSRNALRESRKPAGFAQRVHRFTS